MKFQIFALCTQLVNEIDAVRIRYGGNCHYKKIRFLPIKNTVLSLDGLRCGWPKSIFFASNKSKIRKWVQICSANLSFGRFRISYTVNRIILTYCFWARNQQPSSWWHQSIWYMSVPIKLNGQLSMNVCKQNNNNHFELILIEFRS